MIQEIINHIPKSETAVFALVMSVAAPLMYQAPAAVLRAISWIKSKLTFCVEVHFSDSAYRFVSIWLADNAKYNHFVYRFRVSAISRDRDHHQFLEDKKKWEFVPSYGSSFLKVPGKPLFLFTREQETRKVETDRPPDILKFSGFIWDKKALVDLITSMKPKWADSLPSIHVYSGGEFFDVGKVSCPHNKSLLPPESQEVIAEVKEFIDRRQWYLDRGLNHRLGILLHGEPGTGKTTLIKIVASEFGLPMYVVKAGELAAYPVSILSELEKGSILVIEDIDTAGLANRHIGEEDKENTDNINLENLQKSEYMLGAFLNALDGVIQAGEYILFITTNKPESLDAAMIRPGRIDIIKEIKPLPPQNAQNVFNNFYSTERCGDIQSPITIAELQSIMLKHIDNPDAAALEIHQKEKKHDSFVL